MINMRFFLLFMLLLFFNSYNSQIKKNDNRWQQLDKVVEKQISEKHIPSIAIGVVKNGEILYLKGYGYADLEKKYLPIKKQFIS